MISTVTGQSNVLVVSINYLARAALRDEMPKALRVKNDRIDKELLLEILARALLQVPAILADAAAAQRIRPSTVRRQIAACVSRADFEPGKPIECSLENQMGQKNSGFQRIANRVA